MVVSQREKKGRDVCFSNCASEFRKLRKSLCSERGQKKNFTTTRRLGMTESQKAVRTAPHKHNSTTTTTEQKKGKEVLLFV
jgi:hypothetical protein